MSLLTLVKNFRAGGNLEDYMNALEAKSQHLSYGVSAAQDALFRTHAMPENIKTSEVPFTPAQKRERIKIMLQLMVNTFRIAHSFKSLPKAPEQHISAEDFSDLETLAKELGVTALGSTVVKKTDVFKGKVAPYSYAIVYAVEMDKERIKKAPSGETLLEVIGAYKKSDSIALSLVNFLRQRGFGAYPGLSIGGAVDYCTLAERAGLGTIGYHGLLISPHDGARLRLNIIYTSIINLPKTPNGHLWIRDFCSHCRKCIRSCPPGAIHESPQDKKGGQECISADVCRNYMGENFTCGVCVKVCPFSQAGYEKIKRGFLKG